MRPVTPFTLNHHAVSARHKAQSLTHNLSASAWQLRHYWVTCSQKKPKPKQKKPTTYRHKTKTHAGSTQTSHRRRSIPSKHQTHIQAQQKFKTAQMRTDTFPTSLQNINSRTKINLLTDTRCVLVHKKPQVGCDGKTDMTQPQADEKSQSWDSLTMKAGLPGGLDRYVADLCCQ